VVRALTYHLLLFRYELAVIMKHIPRVSFHILPRRKIIVSVYNLFDFFTTTLINPFY
jgi:hypothetical protein